MTKEQEGSNSLFLKERGSDMKKVKVTAIATVNVFIEIDDSLVEKIQSDEWNYEKRCQIWEEGIEQLSNEVELTPIMTANIEEVREILDVEDEETGENLFTS